MHPQGKTCGFFIYALYCRLKYKAMAKQVQLIMLKNKSTGEVYWTRKNKKKVERKIELKKYSPKLRKHVVFKEGKK
jgi:large subunit ribosomal protein L33